MTEFSFFVESCGDAGEERPQVPGAAKENRRSIRLASALIQRAKSGALVFGSFAQDDAVFFFVERGGDAGEERPQVPGAAKENRRSVRLASELIQRAGKRRAGIRKLRSG
jgi:hypothetical protein